MSQIDILVTNQDLWPCNHPLFSRDLKWIVWCIWMFTWTKYLGDILWPRLRKQLMKSTKLPSQQPQLLLLAWKVPTMKINPVKEYREDSPFLLSRYSFHSEVTINVFRHFLAGDCNAIYPDLSSHSSPKLHILEQQSQWSDWLYTAINRANESDWKCFESPGSRTYNKNHTNWELDFASKIIDLRLFLFRKGTPI